MISYRQQDNIDTTLIQSENIRQQLSILFQNNPKLCLKQTKSGWGTNQRIICVKNNKLYYSKKFKQFPQQQIQDYPNILIPQKYIKAAIDLNDIYQVQYLPKQKIIKKTLAIFMPQNRIVINNKQGGYSSSSILNTQRQQTNNNVNNTLNHINNTNNNINNTNDKMNTPIQNINSTNTHTNINNTNTLNYNNTQQNFIYKNNTQKNNINQQQNQNQSQNMSNISQNNLNGNKNYYDNVKLQKWIFHFNYDLKQKLKSLKQIKKLQEMQQNVLEQPSITQQQESEQADQFNNNNKNYQLNNNNNDNNQNAQNNNNLILKKIPVKFDFAQNQQKKLTDYVNQIKRAKQILRQKQNRQKMQKNQRKKLKQKNSSQYQQKQTNQMTNYMNEQQKFPIQNYWRDYFLALQQLQQKKKPQCSVYEYQLSVMKQINNFKVSCLNLFKNYIYQKINNINLQKYYYNGFYFYKGIWIKLGGKQLNQQFLMSYYISDIVQLLNQTNKTKYRLPNLCFIKYLGFKAICMCDLPYSQLQKSQVYSLTSDGYDIYFLTKIKQHLRFIQKTLNIKVQDIAKQRKNIQAPLGHNIRIYQYNNRKDINASQTSLLQNFYYILNLQNQFPLDFNYQLKLINYQCRLRPQLVNHFRDIIAQQEDDTCLLSSAFLHSNTINQQKKAKQDDKVVKASYYLKNNKIPQLAQKLNNCQIILIDSYSIKMYFKDFGINIRYLYQIYQLSRLKYLTQIIQIQTISRTIKRIFNKSIKQLISTQFVSRIQKQYKAEEDNEDNDNQPNFGQHQDINKKIIQDQKIIDIHSLDFLNLVFGKSNQSDIFWKMIQKQNLQYFKINIQLPFNGSKGCLLHSVLYHCGIQAIFTLDIPLFIVQKPFSTKNQVSLKIKIQNLDFPSFQIQKLVKNYPDLNQISQQNKQFIQKISQKIFKMDLLKNYYLYDNEFNFQTSFSKINLIKQQMIKPNFLSSHHPSQITYYMINKTQANFERGLNLLQFGFSDFHPLYISYYQNYSSSYQPQLLKKSALLQCIKCFGEFHPRTTQLYSKFYIQGYEQFFQRSLRSQDIPTARQTIQDLYKKKKYQSCMSFCLKQLSLCKQDSNRIQKQNALDYLQILFIGMKSATNIRYNKQSLYIGNNISDILNSFRIKNHYYHYQLVQDILKVKLTTAKNKMFLYKIALLCITLQKRYEKHSNFTQQGSLLPATDKLKQDLSTGIMTEYYVYQTHQRWIDHILKNILQSMKYFNYLDDLFNNTEYHIERYNNDYFKDALGYYDVLIRLYGEDVFKNYLYETGNI